MTRLLTSPRFLALALWAIPRLGFAQPTPVTHLAENDPSVTYTGTWYSNGLAGNSGGHAVATSEAGARAMIAFNGTGITWIGSQDPGNGAARVYLDGTLSVVDTYADHPAFQQPLFTARGLTAGPHILSIEVLTMRNAKATGGLIVVDGFDIENGTGISGGVAASAGHIEQNNPAVTYTGPWYLNTNPAQSGGTALLASDPSATATVNFKGTGISWIGYRDEWSGIAKVYVDGVLKTTINTYWQPFGEGFLDPYWKSTTYSITGLPSGNHTLKIEVTGTHDSISADSWIWIDAFNIAP
jgi:hypothetical protein